MLVDGLLTGFQTGLYEFNEQRIKITPTLVSKSKQLQCLVKSGKTVLKSKSVIAMVKVPKAKAYKLLKRGTSNTRGIASFSTKKLKKGSKLYCTVLGQKSTAKTLN